MALRRPPEEDDSRAALVALAGSFGNFGWMGGVFGSLLAWWQVLRRRKQTTKRNLEAARSQLAAQRETIRSDATRTDANHGLSVASEDEMRRGGVSLAQRARGLSIRDEGAVAD